MRKGQKMSAESCRKIGLSKIGNKYLLGFKFSEESKRKMSLSHKGQHSSPATEFKKGAFLPEEMRKKLSLIAKKRGFGLWMIGRKLSEESKIKIGLAHKGKKKTDEARRKMSIARKKIGSPWLIGKKLPESTLIKRRIANRKEKNPNWKGGKTPEYKLIRSSKNYIDWRLSVFNRDNYTCHRCEMRGGKIHPHHIKNFGEWPELRFDVNNGITLCLKCHTLFHKIYGRNNNTKEQLDVFMAN